MDREERAKLMKASSLISHGVTLQSVQTRKFCLTDALDYCRRITQDYEDGKDYKICYKYLNKLTVLLALSDKKYREFRKRDFHVILKNNFKHGTKILDETLCSNIKYLNESIECLKAHEEYEKYRDMQDVFPGIFEVQEKPYEK